MVDPIKILIRVAEIDLKSDNLNIDKVYSKRFVDGKKVRTQLLRLIKPDKLHKDFSKTVQGICKI